MQITITENDEREGRTHRLELTILRIQSEIHDDQVFDLGAYYVFLLECIEELERLSLP